MNLRRFYIEAEVSKGESLHLPEDISHHLRNVLRSKPGDQITVYNGQGGEFSAEVLSVSKKQVIINLLNYREINREANIKVNFGLCILKRDAMDRAIARCVELGVQKLTPLISEHCAVAHRIIKDRRAHWRQIIVAATEQCGLNILPSLMPVTPLPTWLKSVDADLKLVAALNGEALPSSSAIRSVALVTGPEGGFSEEELLNASAAKFEFVKLGDRILRAEVAPVIALSAIHQKWGDFS